MYQALYRKWRPKTFDDVVGQEHITETLKTQVDSDRLSHAYLFIGTRGTGKTSCAKILAKAVNCEAPVNGNPCNRCRACLGIDDGSVLDVVEIDAASNNGVDNVRALRDEAIFSPAMVKKRVYIIDEVHMLSLSAFNALLKILEEPPKHLMFILATTELHKVPATILSRCQRHSFKRLDTKSISDRLNYVASQEHFTLTPDAVALIARLSDGGMRDALSLLDQCSGREYIDVNTVYSAMGLAGHHNTTQLLQHIAVHDSSSALKLFQQLWQDGKDPATLLGEVSSLLRDTLMRKVAASGSGELLSGAYDEQTLTVFSEEFSAGELINAINTIQNTLANMRNGQAKTLCELCLISLAEPDLNDNIPQLRERIARLERTLANSISAVPTASAPSAPVHNSKSEPAVEDLPIPTPAPTQTATPVDEVPFDLPVQQKTQFVPKAPVVANEPAVPSPTPVSHSEWLSISQAFRGQFPAGIQALLMDPASVSGVVSGEVLTLYVEGAFAMNNIKRPDTLAKIGSIASSTLGHPVQVKVDHMSKLPRQDSPSVDASVKVIPEPVTAPTPETSIKHSNLDELSKFEIVSFK